MPKYTYAYPQSYYFYQYHRFLFCSLNLNIFLIYKTFYKNMLAKLLKTMQVIRELKMSAAQLKCQCVFPQFEEAWACFWSKKEFCSIFFFYKIHFVLISWNRITFIQVSKNTRVGGILGFSQNRVSHYRDPGRDESLTIPLGKIPLSLKVTNNFYLNQFFFQFTLDKSIIHQYNLSFFLVF